MSGGEALPVFSAYGIELEYMIVDRTSLSVLPIADQLLAREAGKPAANVSRGSLGWSNELVLHLVEIKNRWPDSDLKSVAGAFQDEVRYINRLLEPMGAMLMPTATHPWMDPRAEAQLWPHENAAIYQTYDRIFDCRRHGWANIQSMHLNLPFAGDEEFARLHAAVRLVLPILPALAASSPFAMGQSTGYQDFRMAVYRTHPARIASMIAQVVPEPINSRAEYEQKILAPMYRDIAPLDRDGNLQYEWLNCRGAIPRFDRSALEIRVIDMQECPQADFAIAFATAAVIKALYHEQWTPFSAQQSADTDALARILATVIRDGDVALIDDASYLELLGFSGHRCSAQRLWRHLIDAVAQQHPEFADAWRGPLETILEYGSLARRITRAVGADQVKARLPSVYRELCNCLQQGSMFVA